MSTAQSTHLLIGAQTKIEPLREEDCDERQKSLALTGTYNDEKIKMMSNTSVNPSGTCLTDFK